MNISTINLIQQCAVAIFVINKYHEVIYWNKACETLTGMKANTVLGKSIHWQAFYDSPHPCLSDLIIDKDFSHIENHFENYTKSLLLTDGWHAEGWHNSLGGKRRYVIFDAAPIYDGKKDVVASIETIQDITERKQVEEENALLAEKLQQALDKLHLLQNETKLCSNCQQKLDSRQEKI